MNTNEAARRAGASFRQMDYWARVGVFPGQTQAGSGKQRLWTVTEVVLARACVLLSQLANPSGFSFSGTRFAQTMADVALVAKTASDFRDWWLVVTPRMVYLDHSEVPPVSDAAILVNLHECHRYVTRAPGTGTVAV